MHQLLFILLISSLLVALPPHLSVLDYYHRLPPNSLPEYRATRPTVADAANGYLLVQPSAKDALHYAEVAVWKRPDGSDLVGANYQTVSGGPGCGDDTCEPTIHFYTYAPRDPHKTDAQLLHRFNPAEPAWPSPRTWVLAGQLLAAGLAVAPAVGEGAAAEFDAYRALYADLPDLDLIRQGKGEELGFPAEPSARYATVVGLALRIQNGREGGHAFRWLVDRAGAEWVQAFAADALRHLRNRKQLGELAKLLQEDERLQRFFTEYQELLAG